MRKRLSPTVRFFFRALGIIVLLSLAYLFAGFPQVYPNTQYGVTWSDQYARFLGLDERAGFQAVLDDLQVKLFRIPAYWNEIETRRGTFHFERLTEQLDAIAAHGGKAILVVGATEPRWPECWLPSWAQGLPMDEREAAQENYERKMFEQFARHPALGGWQVENEPLFSSFGACKDQPKKFLDDEIRMMRDLEASAFPPGERHPVLTTDSGEFSTWLGFPGLTDQLGISIYRKVLTSHGVWNWDFLTTVFYRRHAALVEPWTGPIFVSEFQMEPWVLGSLPDTPLNVQFKTLDLQQMKDNFWFAERVGFPRVYFWGAEWWYWMKVKMGHPEFWNEAKSFLAAHS